MKSFILIMAVGLLFLLGCVQTGPAPNNQTNISNQTNVTEQNNTNVTPPSGNGTNQTTPPGYEVKDYCEKDSDCVRQKKCCDCGLGEYVNTYNVDEPNCTGPQCLCPIMLSRGECRENRCTAAVLNETPAFNASTDFYFRSETGACGSEKKPVKQIIESGTKLNGSIGTPNPCYIADAQLITGNDSFILNITTRPLQTFAACATCKGSISWLADIYNYKGNLQIFYDGRLMLNDSDVFCGWNVGECGSDSDCYASGCYREVCQSKESIRVFTNCDPRVCYDSGKYRMRCGCVSGKCAWHR